MKEIKRAFSPEHAKNYDQKALEAEWLDPEIIFGLTYKYIEPNETILDIGIGTGLSSALFHKAGLRVYGIDLSPGMLEICKQKKITVDLKQHDLTLTPYPFESNSMNHAVCTGVTHILKDLSPIFEELARILKKNGIFSFEVADSDDTGENARAVTSEHNHSHDHSKKIKKYCYSQTAVNSLLNRYGFQTVSSLRYSASSIGHRHSNYNAYIVRKKPS